MPRNDVCFVPRNDGHNYHRHCEKPYENDEAEKNVEWFSWQSSKACWEEIASCLAMTYASCLAMTNTTITVIARKPYENDEAEKNAEWFSWQSSKACWEEIASCLAMTITEQNN